MDCTNFLQSTISPHFHLGGKVGKLIKRKRVFCWSIFIISLRCGPLSIYKSDRFTRSSDLFSVIRAPWVGAVGHLKKKMYFCK